MLHDYPARGDWPKKTPTCCGQWVQKRVTSTTGASSAEWRVRGHSKIGRILRIGTLFGGHDVVFAGTSWAMSLISKEQIDWIPAKLSR